MKKFKTAEYKTCSVCNNVNSELVIFDTKIYFFVPKKIYVCQTCISKAFRSLRRENIIKSTV